MVKWQNPKAIKLDKSFNDLRLLVVRRDQLTSLIAIEKQHLCTITVTTDKDLLNSIKRVINSLGKELAKIKEKIEVILANNSELSHKEEVILSCKGIGKTTASSLIAYLPELGMINNKQIASLVGVAPKNNDSGKFKGRRYIQGGRKHIRNALYMCTLSLISHKNNKFYDFYKRLVDSGKAKK